MRDIHNDTKNQTEDELQQKCFFWHWNEYPNKRKLLFHVPNGGARNKREGARFKNMGVIAGVSDFVLLNKGKAYFIELKVKNRTQKIKQKEWEQIVVKELFCYFLVNSLVEFKQLIDTLYE